MFLSQTCISATPFFSLHPSAGLLAHFGGHSLLCRERQSAKASRKNSKMLCSPLRTCCQRPLSLLLSCTCGSVYFTNDSLSSPPVVSVISCGSVHDWQVSQAAQEAGDCLSLLLFFGVFICIQIFLLLFPPASLLFCSRCELLS